LMMSSTNANTLHRLWRLIGASMSCFHFNKF
jgi:hypothetical protein